MEAIPRALSSRTLPAYNLQASVFDDPETAEKYQPRPDWYVDHACVCSAND
jgi:hypothetical protein